MGNRIAQVEEDGAETTYSYDDNDRLIEVQYPLEKIEKIRETYLNNSIHGYSDNSKHHIHSDKGKHLGWDKAKKNKEIFQAMLEEEDLPTYMVNPQSQVQYTYDEAGNRMTLTDDDGTINYYYDEDNRLVSEGGNELKYDENGNLIQKTDENGITNYSYDAAGRLSQVALANDTSVNYSYDAYGRKIFEKETNWQYTGKTRQLRAQTTSYLYRGEQLLKEYTGEGSPLAEYYTANGRVIARNMFGFHDRKTWGHQDTVRTRGGLMYYHYDALGNVTDFTDRLGQNVVKYRWDAFGGMFAGVLAPYSHMGITGKEYDPKTGLVFFGSRWYSPMVGQFIMPDSFMGELNKPQSLNSYAYAWNNPVNNIDPTGHWVDNGDGTYTAESGDTLWGLAEETTGNGSNWTDLGYTGTPENLQIGETVGTPSGGTSSGDTSSGDTSSGDTSSGNDNGGSSSGGGGYSDGGGSSGGSGGGSSSGGGSGGGYSGGGSYAPPPPPPPPPSEGGSVTLPTVVSDTWSIDSIDKSEQNIPDITDKLNNLMATYEDRYKYIKFAPDPVRFKVFYDLVHNGGELDLKNQPGWQNEKFIYNSEVIDNDVPGNIVYGYVGKVFGFSETTLYVAAGAAQMKAGTSKEEWQNLIYFGDDPRDQARIRQGINLYKEKHNTKIDRLIDTIF